MPQKALGPSRSIDSASARGQERRSARAIRVRRCSRSSRPRKGRGSIASDLLPTTKTPASRLRRRLAPQAGARPPGRGAPRPARHAGAERRRLAPALALGRRGAGGFDDERAAAGAAVLSRRSASAARAGLFGADRLRRTPDRVLVESLLRLGRQERNLPRRRRRVRARGDPTARARPLRRHAARGRAAPGDAELPRQRAVDRPQLDRRPQQPVGAQREPRARDPRAAHDGRRLGLCAGRRDPARLYPHRLDDRRARRQARRAGRVRLQPQRPRAAGGDGARPPLCRGRRRPGRGGARRSRPRAGDRRAHRDETCSPLRRRRARSGFGRAPRQDVSRQRRRPRRARPRACRRRRGLARAGGQGAQSLGS